jgi:hypothetical protein
MQVTDSGQIQCEIEFVGNALNNNGIKVNKNI